MWGGGCERNRLIMLVRARLLAVYACAQLPDKQTHSVAGTAKEVSNNAVFFFFLLPPQCFLSESPTKALRANIALLPPPPSPLLISLCSWAALPHLDAPTKPEVATLIGLSVACLGRN